jgi:hypothetical protein
MAKSNSTVPTQHDYEARKQALDNALAYFHRLIEPAFGIRATVDPLASAKIAALHYEYM